MDHAVVARGRDRYTGVHELVGIRLTFVAKRIIFRSDDECRRQALEFFVAGTERRYVTYRNILFANVSSVRIALGIVD